MSDQPLPQRQHGLAVDGERHRRLQCVHQQRQETLLARTKTLKHGCPGEPQSESVITENTHRTPAPSKHQQQHLRSSTFDEWRIQTIALQRELAKPAQQAMQKRESISVSINLEPTTTCHPKDCLDHERANVIVGDAAKESTVAVGRRRVGQRCDAIEKELNKEKSFK